MNVAFHEDDFWRRETLYALPGRSSLEMHCWSFLGGGVSSIAVFKQKGVDGSIKLGNDYGGVGHMVRLRALKKNIHPGRFRNKMGAIIGHQGLLNSFSEQFAKSLRSGACINFCKKKDFISLRIGIHHDKSKTDKNNPHECVATVRMFVGPAST